MKTNKRRVHISAHRTVNTFARLRTISYECYERAKETNAGSTLMLSASMVFSAFTVEAFLNHIGANRTTFWSSVERKLLPRDKLDLLANLYDLEIDFSKRPFQTFKRMFRLRDALAHGKTESITEESTKLLREDEQPEISMTNWEKEINFRNAKMYFDDSKALFEILCTKTSMDPMDLMVGSEYESISRKSIQDFKKGKRRTILNPHQSFVSLNDFATNE
jgi:hypothetical protein